MDLFLFIKNALPIVDVVSGYASLRPSGHYLKSSCPFHKETDASFTVSPDKQIFYCFGCHATGDVIAFMARVENVSQIEAARLLIERYNLTVPEAVLQAGFKGIKQQNYEVRDRCAQVNKLVAEWTNKNLLKNSVVLEYLYKRGISDIAIKLFSIGYFPSGINAINAMIKELGAQGVLVKELIEAGVFVDGKVLYSPFEERVVFPIKDYLGKHCGFGGRIFRERDERPKYYNSKESEFFAKSKLLFGLDQARKSMQDSSQAFLVEGYMDCVAMVQHGYSNTIATLGTACTSDHLKILARYVDKLFLLYDGDSAGQKAMLRIAELCWDVAIEVYVVILPAKEDPASYLQRYGSLQSCIDKAESLIAYFIKSVGAHFGGKSLAEKIKAAEKMFEIIIRIQDSLKRDLILQQAAAVMGLPLPSVQQALREYQIKNNRKNYYEESEHQEKLQESSQLEPIDNELQILEEKVLYALLECIREEGIFNFEASVAVYFSQPVREVLERLIVLIDQHGLAVDVLSLLSSGLSEDAELLLNRLAFTYQGVVKGSMINSLVGMFLKHHWKLIVQDMKQKMADATVQKDADAMRALVATFTKLKQQFVDKGLV